MQKHMKIKSPVPMMLNSYQGSPIKQNSNIKLKKATKKGLKTFVVTDGGVVAIGTWARDSIANAHCIVGILTKISYHDLTKEYKSINLSRN